MMVYFFISACDRELLVVSLNFCVGMESICVCISSDSQVLTLQLVFKVNCCLLRYSQPQSWRWKELGRDRKERQIEKRVEEKREDKERGLRERWDGRGENWKTLEE